MNTWYEYRLVWSAHPWVAVILAVGVLLVVGAVVGMVVGSPAAVVFIPGLAAIFLHHLVVQKASGSER